MAVGSIVLAALSLASIGLGVLATPVPVLGAIFSFAAPALALAGIIAGGIAMSRARRENQPRDLALAGVIASALCFVPALITALTCGVCNALCSAGPVEIRRDFHFGVQPGATRPPGADAGRGGSGRPAPALAPLPRAGSPEPAAGSGARPDAPPPAFPPPPIHKPPP
jgi:hypothetical protein